MDRWIKQELSSDFRIKSNSLRSSPSQSIKIRALKIDQYIPSGLFIDPPTTERTTRYYGTIDYLISNKQFLKPKNLRLSYVYGLDESRSLVNNVQLTSNLTYVYNKKRDKLNIRLYGGYHFYQNIGNEFCFYLRGIQGSTDYLYDHIFLGRNVNNFENTLSQQNTNTYGGFKVNSLAGKSDDWLLSTNINTDIPGLPFGLFLDLAYYDEPLFMANISSWTTNHILSYNAGLKATLIQINNKPILEIYVPLMYSENIGSSRNLTNAVAVNELSFFQRINFIFNFKSLNPFLIKKQIKP